MASLDELRADIDRIDEELVAKLTRRAELVLEVKKAKQLENVDVYSPARERQILDRVLALSANGPFPAGPLERIFVNIISATRSLIGDLHISYLGPEGSLAFEASEQQFGEAVYHAASSSIKGVFAHVERGEANYGVVPARTSSTGLVTETFDVLMQSNLKIIAELEVKERLSLFSHSGGLGDIDRIYSDAHSFIRSSAWLRANLPGVEEVLVESLADALKKFRAHPKAALIGLERLSAREDVHVAASGIESEVGADTRFIVLGSKTPPTSGHDKTSLLCSVEERAGALRELLQPFSMRGITMLKIESRPMRGRAWEYVFFIDVLGHQDEPKIADAIKELTNLSSYLKVLGSYPLVCQS
jgi:chorismate mutase/prephenate dehydratase